jgi:tetratricopeptide (TPR) repeat protein
MAAQPPLAASSADAIQKAREAESGGRPEDAAKLYEFALKDNRLDEFPFDRLMVIYRKLKQYNDELRIIDKGIRLFEEHYKKPVRKNSARQQQISTLSNAFLKTAGLKDKKGKLLYIPEPISRWMKRKAVVEKKIK